MVLCWLDRNPEQASEDLFNLLHGEWQVTTKRNYGGRRSQTTKGTCVFNRRPATRVIRPMYPGLEEQSSSDEIVQTITETRVDHEDKCPFAFAMPLIRTNFIQVQKDSGWRFDYTFPATHPDGARRLHAWPCRVQIDPSSLEAYHSTKKGPRPLVLLAQKLPVWEESPEIRIRWGCSDGKREIWIIRYEYWEPEAEAMCNVEDILER